MLIFQYSSLISPMNIDTVIKASDLATATIVDLRDIKVVK